MNHVSSLLSDPAVQAVLIHVRRWLAGELRGNLGIDSDSLLWMTAMTVTTAAGLKTWLQHNLRTLDETA